MLQGYAGTGLPRRFTSSKRTRERECVWYVVVVGVYTVPFVHVHIGLE